jgi:ABC-type transport system substrate-binding protein
MHGVGDPQKMKDAFSMAVVNQIYRGLLRYNSNSDVLPDLAESWSESADI